MRLNQMVDAIIRLTPARSVFDKDPELMMFYFKLLICVVKYDYVKQEGKLSGYPETMRKVDDYLLSIGMCKWAGLNVASIELLEPVEYNHIRKWLKADEIDYALKITASFGLPLCVESSNLTLDQLADPKVVLGRRRADNFPDLPCDPEVEYLHLLGNLKDGPAGAVEFAGHVIAPTLGNALASPPIPADCDLSSFGSASASVNTPTLGRGLHSHFFHMDDAAFINQPAELSGNTSTNQPEPQEDKE